MYVGTNYQRFVDSVSRMSGLRDLVFRNLITAHGFCLSLPPIVVELGILYERASLIQIFAFHHPPN
jgi:hypothetical protein